MVNCAAVNGDSAHRWSRIRSQMVRWIVHTAFTLDEPGINVPPSRISATRMHAEPLLALVCRPVRQDRAPRSVRRRCSPGWQRTIHRRSFHRHLCMSPPLYKDPGKVPLSFAVSYVTVLSNHRLVKAAKSISPGRSRATPGSKICKMVCFLSAVNGWTPCPIWHVISIMYLMSLVSLPAGPAGKPTDFHNSYPDNGNAGCWLQRKPAGPCQTAVTASLAANGRKARLQPRARQNASERRQQGKWTGVDKSGQQTESRII